MPMVTVNAVCKVEIIERERGKLLQAFREGFQAYGKNRAYELHCKHKSATEEKEYWWEGFFFAAEMCEAVLLEKNKQEDLV